MKFFTSKLLARSNISRMNTSTQFLYFAVIDGPINIFIIILYSFKFLIAPDLPPEAPSFITRVYGFGFHILLRQFEQARRVRSPQISQALGALQRVFGCAEMSAV